MKTVYVITKEIFTGEYSAPDVEQVGVYMGNNIKDYLEKLSGHKAEKPVLSRDKCVYYSGVAYDYYYLAYKTKVLED